jgi:hypothetical protein
MTRSRTVLFLTAAALLAAAACSSPVAIPARDLPAASAASKQQPGPGEASTTSGGDGSTPTDSAIAGNVMGSGN